ncbi:MAG: hypothetical protein EBY29_01020, partial [Planctomycetes bacterium]|nr:hypothetical protein [Planctomycetota bacterium]
MAKFKFESVKFEHIMADYAEIREVTIPDAVSLNARLLCVELARRTQPFGEEQTSGTIRVKNDIGKIIKTTEQLDEYADRVGSQRIKARLKALIKSGRFDIVETILRNIGFLNKWTGLEFLDSKSAIKTHHQDARVKPTGRTKTRGSKLFISSGSELNTYITEIQKRVGISKGGWAECASQLKKVNKGGLLTGFPSWVKKAIRSGSGSVQDLTSNIKSPKVTLTNNVPWVSQILPASEQLNALSVVATKMRSQMNRILK